MWGVSGSIRASHVILQIAPSTQFVDAVIKERRIQKDAPPPPFESVKQSFLIEY